MDAVCSVVTPRRSTIRTRLNPRSKRLRIIQLPLRDGKRGASKKATHQNTVVDHVNSDKPVHKTEGRDKEASTPINQNNAILTIEDDKIDNPTPKVRIARVIRVSATNR